MESSHRKLRTACRWAAATAVVLPAIAGLVPVAGAASLPPPSLSIRVPQNAVVVATLLEVDGDRLRFRRDRVLQEDRALEVTGREPPEEVVVRVEAPLPAPPRVGASYILGYSSLVGVQGGRHTFSPDPEGARVAVLPAVGPALLEDSPALRTLVTPRPAGEELAPRRRLDLIVDQLERPDPTGRLFVLAEMVVWHELRDVLTESDLALFRRLVSRGELAVRAREYVLRAFVPIRQRVGEDWLVAECRRALAELGPELDLLSAGPSLVTLSLDSLRRMGSRQDGVAALGFLGSNSDAVSLAALRTAMELAPERAEEVVGQLVLVGDLPLDTEREALRFLARRQTARRQAEGTD